MKEKMLLTPQLEHPQLEQLPPQLQVLQSQPPIVLYMIDIYVWERMSLVVGG